MKRLFLRVLALGVLATIVLAAFLAIVMPPWQAAIFEREIYEQSLQRLARQDTIDKRSSDYQVLLDQYPQDLIDQRIYRATTTVSAETTFQKDVNDLAQKSGLVLNSTNGQLARPAGGFTQLGVRMDASGDTKQLAGFLRAIRNHRKVLVFSKASIRVKRPERDSGPAELALNIEIIGYGKI